MADPKIGVNIVWNNKVVQATVVRGDDAMGLLTKDLSRVMDRSTLIEVLGEVQAWAEGRGHTAIVPPEVAALAYAPTSVGRLQIEIVPAEAVEAHPAGMAASQIGAGLASPSTALDTETYVRLFLDMSPNDQGYRNAKLLVWVMGNGPLTLTMPGDAPASVEAAQILMWSLVDNMKITAVMLIAETWMAPPDDSGLTPTERLDAGDPAVRTGFAATVVDGDGVRFYSAYESVRDDGSLGLEGFAETEVRETYAEYIEVAQQLVAQGGGTASG